MEMKNTISSLLTLMASGDYRKGEAALILNRKTLAKITRMKYIPQGILEDESYHIFGISVVSSYHVPDNFIGLDSFDAISAINTRLDSDLPFADAFEADIKSRINANVFAYYGMTWIYIEDREILTYSLSDIKITFDSLIEVIHPRKIVFSMNERTAAGIRDINGLEPGYINFRDDLAISNYTLAGLKLVINIFIPDSVIGLMAESVAQQLVLKHQGDKASGEVLRNKIDYMSSKSGLFLSGGEVYFKLSPIKDDDEA